MATEEEMKDVRTKTKSTRMGKELRDFVTELRKNISRDDDDRTAWKRKLTIATNQRLGVKRASNRPYPGAPNIPLPETDKQIRKKKPVYVLAVMGQSKPVQLSQPLFGEPVPPEQLKRAEAAFNQLLTRKMNLLRKLTVAADQFMEKGFCIFKVIERFSVERVHNVVNVGDFEDELVEQFRQLADDEKRVFLADEFGLDEEFDSESIDSIVAQFNSGEDQIEYFEDKISSFPEILVRDSEKVLFPSYMDDITQSERVTDEFFLSERQLMERGLNGTYDLTKIKKNIKLGTKKVSSKTDDIVEAQKNTNEGIVESTNSELYRMHESYAWRPTGPKGRYERWVITFMADVANDNDATVGIRRFLDDEWPFEKHDNEVKDERAYSSRGIPEQIRALQQFMEKAINNMLIRDDINNNPVYTVLSTSKVQASTIRFIPGQTVRVGRHDEVQELGNRTQKVDLSSNLIGDKLKAFAEEYLGSTDQLFRNATNQGGGKTLGEIERGIQLSVVQQQLDLLLWNETMKRVYRKVWKNLRSGLLKPFFVNGERVTREDFAFEPEIMPTGTVEALDKNANVQRAIFRVQQIIQQVQLGLIANADDLYNAMQDYLEKDGIKDPNRFITQPAQIQREKQAAAAAQAQALQQQEQQIAQQEARLIQQGVAQGETGGGQ